MIEVTARHMVGGRNNEHIAEVKYKKPRGSSKTATRQAMVTWLDEKDSNKAIVYSSDRRSSSYVGVVHGTGAPDYIRNRSLALAPALRREIQHELRENSREASLRPTGPTPTTGGTDPAARP